MYKSFKRRLAKAKDVRLRKHRMKPKKKFCRPASHMESFLQEVSEDVRHVTPVSLGRCSGTGLGIAATLGPAAFVEGLAIAATQDGVEKVGKLLTLKARRAALEKRRTYYETENAKRRMWSVEIRKAIPKPLHRCPTPSALEEAYARRRESAEWKLRFGELMIDLEEYARREYEISGNKFTGSSGGVRDWLKKHCPLLAKHYWTCQRYKRMAQDDPHLFREQTEESEERPEEKAKMRQEKRRKGGANKITQRV